MPALLKRVGDAHPFHCAKRDIVLIVTPQSAPAYWANRTVVVTGGNGFLGSKVVARLRGFGANVVAPRSVDADLTRAGVAEELFNAHRPSHVIHLAARVGGIGYNMVAPAQLYLDNMKMGLHTIEAARTCGVDKTVILGTVCSYPKFTPVPFREESLWDGYPEETNAPYGIAKKAMLVHAQVNEAQYGQQFAFVIPTNLYGPGDKFHESVSHVIPALIKKCVEAKERGDDKVSVWGTGAASRDYLYVEDAAEAIVLAAQLRTSSEPMNLGNNREVTIRETAETIARVVGFAGELVWDPTRPDGQPRRRVDASRAERELGWHAHTDFEAGLRATVDWYLAHREIAEAPPTH